MDWVLLSWTIEYWQVVQLVILKSLLLKNNETYYATFTIILHKVRNTFKRQPMDYSTFKELKSVVMLNINMSINHTNHDPCPQIV